MAEALVRALLPDLDEIKALENPNHFTGLENRKIAQLRNADRVCAYELSLKVRFAFLQQELQNFLEVGI